MIPRSLLFAPGDSPAKMKKAYETGADAVILDLEDSVEESNKPKARGLVAAFLGEHARDRKASLWVRINPLSTGLALGDLAAVVPGAPDGIVLPKPDSAAAVIELSLHLAELEAAAKIGRGTIKILPIATETPKSVFSLGTYADASERLVGLTWGAEDLSAALGARTARDEAGELTFPYQLARALCLAGAAAADVAAIETVYPDFRDLAGLENYVKRGRRDGFVGMMAIHPSQVAIINGAFTPTETELAHARRIVAAFAANPGVGTIAIDGKMIDAPHLKQARRLLDLADQSR